jgi:RNA polymerase sigma-70 factor, ECF subfamily
MSVAVVRQKVSMESRTVSVGDGTRELQRALEQAIRGDQRAADRIGAALLAEDADGVLLDQVALAAAGGSVTALDLLLTAVDQLPLLRAAIGRLVLEPATVDDVAQDVLIAVAEKIAGFRGEAKFTTWLYQVARFKAIDHLRRQRDADALDEETAPDPTETERMSSLIATRTTIRDAIEALPEHYRTAVVLRDVERVPYAEIAELVGIPVNTAKTRVARGRALLAGRLATGAT